MDSPDQALEQENFEEVYPTLIEVANKIGIQTIFFSKIKLKAVKDKELIDISGGLNPFHQNKKD